MTTTSRKAPTPPATIIFLFPSFLEGVFIFIHSTKFETKDSMQNIGFWTMLTENVWRDDCIIPCLNLCRGKDLPESPPHIRWCQSNRNAATQVVQVDWSNRRNPGRHWWPPDSRTVGKDGAESPNCQLDISKVKLTLPPFVSERGRPCSHSDLLEHPSGELVPLPFLA